MLNKKLFVGGIGVRKACDGYLGLCEEKSCKVRMNLSNSIVACLKH